MKTMQYTTVDKSTWGEGPWSDEPDKMQFVDRDTGLPCLIVRNRVGSLCGYVGVPEGHPLFQHGYDENGGIEVHGGLTFAGFCHDDSREQWEQWRKSMISRKDEAAKFPKGDMAQAWKDDGHLVDDFDAWKKDHECTSICHKVEPDENDRVWWLGFDTAHGCDISPAMQARERIMMPELCTHDYGTYKDLEYVQNECRNLCRQLKEIENAGT